jgi:hypothetical protein
MFSSIEVLYYAVLYISFVLYWTVQKFCVTFSCVEALFLLSCNRNFVLCCPV